MTDDDVVDSSRRHFLTVATLATGAVGAGLVAVPFISSLNPSARAQALGAPVEVPLGSIQPGEMIRIIWRGKVVYVLRRTKEMALLNPILSAEQAMEWGLVNRVVADDQVLSTALEIAHKLAKGPTRSFGETKRLILTGATESLESQMERESRIIAAIAGSADGREGIAAFVAKRTPEFQGK